MMRFPHIILHIDMNSYFASVEQQARPFLRGKPIGVTGSNKKRTVIVAASVEAKKYGVKTGTQLHDARKLCPQLILVTADCKRYEAVTSKFLKIFISKTPLVEIFSIDEAFLDLSTQVGSFEQAKKIALDIKRELKEAVGKFVRCSVGIGQNKFIAKLASEAKKPDGLTIVRPGEEIKFIDRFELEDACGIGSRIALRLNLLGVNSFKDLRSLTQTQLTTAFRSYGLKLYNIARGQDHDPVRPYYEKEDPKSISRSKTTDRDITDLNIIKKFLLVFCETIARDLRAKNFTAGSIAIILRHHDFTHTFAHRLLRTQTNETKVLYQNSLQALANCRIYKPVRKIAVVTGELKRNTDQLTLGPDFDKGLILDRICDQINRRLGRRTIKRAALVDLHFTGETANFGFQKDAAIFNLNGDINFPSA